MAMWDLLREMENLRRDIDQAFTGFGRGWLQPAFLPGLGTAEYPQVNVGEDHDHLYVEALVPGMDPESLELTVMRGTLTIWRSLMSDKNIPVTCESGSMAAHEKTREKYLRPAVDIFETEEGLTLLADLPGVDNFLLPRQLTLRGRPLSLPESHFS